MPESYEELRRRTRKETSPSPSNFPVKLDALVERLANAKKWDIWEKKNLWRKVDTWEYFWEKQAPLLWWRFKRLFKKRIRIKR